MSGHVDDTLPQMLKHAWDLNSRSLHVQVFVVPLQRKPLFPGTLMPVQLRDRKLISEIQEMKKDK